MRSRQSFLRFIAALLVSLLLFGVLSLSPTLIAHAAPSQHPISVGHAVSAIIAHFHTDRLSQPPSAENALTQVMARVRDVGSYRFIAHIETTLIPRPSSAMIGRSDLHLTLRLDGEQLGPDRSHITLHLLDDPRSPALLIEQDGIHVTVTQGGRRVEQSLPIDPSTVASDFLHFLAAATDVHRLPSDASAETHDTTRFAYRIDGSRLAHIYTERIADELRRAAQVPDLDVTIPTSAEGATGTGELWVDKAGLPARQVLDLEMPGASQFYDSHAHIIIDYDFPARARMGEGRWTADDRQGLSLSSVIHHLLPVAPTTLTDILLFLLPLTLTYTLITHRTHRRAYIIVAPALSLIIVTAPVLRTFNVARFYKRIALAATQPSAASHQQVATGSAQSTYPLRPSSIALRSTSSKPTSPAHILAAASTPGLRCGSGKANTDTDGDGISDRDENCLGTDPYRSDTDYDRIPDKVELDGIEWPASSGHMWYGDPISPDTNNDGLNDLYEWPKPYGTAPEWDVDNDGIPNPWDDDNDGDGVPDKIDLSPYAYTDYISSFTLSTRGSGF
ncbi:MAG: thrombospondin type 3 repeat-containing protein, partial [Anaerolineae bacterium]|nr:thrombospondin type 3 repeat-containing protein [Anaerolineae bacterium]